MRLCYAICETLINEYKAAVGLSAVIRRCPLRVDRNENQQGPTRIPTVSALRHGGVASYGVESVVFIRLSQGI